MTIYYVDPYVGSNAAAGTSWGTAWRWLPGNGTTILPGDEIRYAKSASYDITASSTQKNTVAFGTNSTSVWKARTLYSFASGGLAGVTAQSVGCDIAGGTVVPANTKLCYGLVSGTGYSPITSLFATLSMQGVPSGPVGTYLKIVVCSDALGDVPIVTLTGHSVFSTSPSSPSGVSVGVQFSYENVTSTAITIGSVAIYSVAGFTLPAVGGSLATDGLVFGPSPTLLTYFGLGHMVEFITPSIPTGLSLSDVGAYPREAYQVANMVRYTDNMVYLSTLPQGRMAYTTQAYSLRAYAPLPDHPDTYTDATPLTFNGTAGSYIRIRGGFNTGTGLQDGYTNIGGIYRTGPVPRDGAFVFSAGGQYLEFERFDCTACNLIYYSYSTPSFTIPIIKTTDCTLGSKDVYTNRLNSLLSENSIVGVAPSTTQLTIQNVQHTRSSVWGLCSARRGGSYKTLASDSANAYFAEGQLTYGSMSFVDCVIAQPGATLGAALLNVTVGFIVTSSTQNYRSSVFPGQPGQSSLVVANTITVPLEFTNVYFSCTGTTVGITVKDYTTVPNAVAIHLTRVAIGSSLTRTASDSFRLYGFDTVFTNGVIFCSPDATYSTSLYISNSEAGRALHPSGSITLQGMWGAIYSSTNTFLELEYPPAAISGSGMSAVTGIASAGSFPAMYMNIRFPSLVTTLTNLRFTIIEVFSPPASGFDSASLEVVDCDTRLIVPNYTHTGYAKVIGGTISAVTDVTSARKATQSGLAVGVSYYGVTTSFSISPQLLINLDDSPAWPRRIIATGLKSTTSITPASTTASWQVRSPIDLHLSPETTLTDATARTDAVTSMRRGDGVGFHVNGISTVHIPGTVGPYGMLEMRVLGSVPLAELDVEAGSTVTLTLSVVATASTILIMELVPCNAFSSDLLNHVMRKNIRTYNTTLSYSFSFAPQKSGNVSVKLFTSTRVTVQQFSVAVS